MRDVSVKSALSPKDIATCKFLVIDSMSVNHGHEIFINDETLALKS